MYENNEIIKRLLSYKDKNLSIISFADLSEVESEARFGLRYGICIAVALKVLPSLTNEPSYDYYTEYKAVSKQLRETSYYLEEQIQAMGYQAYSLARNKQNDQFITLLPFKTLATRAGIGWIGKSATLVTKEYGNAIRLHGVITDMPFETAEPINESYCGDCHECVDHCPAKAVVGNNWSLKTPRMELLDPFACKAKVIERGKVFGVTEGSCGICLSCCPWTKKYFLKLLDKQ